MASEKAIKAARDFVERWYSLSDCNTAVTDHDQTMFAAGLASLLDAERADAASREREACAKRVARLRCKTTFGGTVFRGCAVDAIRARKEG